MLTMAVGVRTVFLVERLGPYIVLIDTMDEGLIITND